MASTIVTKNSSTASAVPLTGDLTQGELAVNVTDKKLYTKDSGGTVVKLVGGLGNQEANAVAITGGSVNGTTIGATTASTGAFTTLSASSTTTLSGGTANGVAYLNGSKVVTTGSALTFDGTNITNSQSTASPIGFKLNNSSASTSAGTRLTFQYNSGDTGYVGNQFDGSDFNNQYAANRFHIWLNNGAEQMRLTSTGLGIGTSSPGYKVQAAGTIAAGVSASSNGRFRSFNSSNDRFIEVYSDGTNGIINSTYSSAGAAPLLFQVTDSTKMTLDSSGNLGLGVTPSSWATYKALQVGQVGALWANPSGTDVYWSANHYFGSGSDRYIANGLASYYRQSAGVHSWGIAPSGTAGNAITFTQAMTLDASGNLLVGKTSTGLATGVQLEAAGGSSFVRSASTNSDLNLYVYSTGAGAARFYVGMGGTVYATSTTITAISDQRLKENIQDLDVGLDKIMSLKPRKFDWKAGKGKDKKGDRGWIAQEFEQVFPDMVDTWADPAPEGEEPYKAVNADLIPVLVKAIQEQQAIIEQLKADVAALKGA